MIDDFARARKTPAARCSALPRSALPPCSALLCYEKKSVDGDVVIARKYRVIDAIGALFMSFNIAA